ncbi:MAG: DUF222 domain-containing protein [Ilumatobacteraceae bacterium]
MIDELATTDLDTLQTDELSELLGAVRRPLNRLTAIRTRLAGELTSRRIAAAPPGRTGPAIRAVHTEIADQSQQSPSEAKTTSEAGRHLRDHPASAAAFAAGDVREEHVKIIGRILSGIEATRRVEIERELLALAKNRDPVSFGRAARDLAHRHAPEEEERNDRRCHIQRRVRATDTTDGGFAFSGLLYGVQAETAREAMKAFNRIDSPGEHRTPEQRAADGFEQLCATALQADAAPSRHGTRPQVLVVVTADQLDQDHGVARFGSGQPVSMRRLRPLLTDSAVGRITLTASGTPIEASEMVRTVPAGLWRALIARDRGCTWEGCDAPPAWCDVAHGPVPYRKNGRLSPQNAALLCRRHHRTFDHGSWRITIDGDRVSYTRPVDAIRHRPADSMEDRTGAAARQHPNDRVDQRVIDGSYTEKPVGASRRPSDVVSPRPSDVASPQSGRVADPRPSDVERRTPDGDADNLPTAPVNVGLRQPTLDADSHPGSDSQPRTTRMPRGSPDDQRRSVSPRSERSLPRGP